MVATCAILTSWSVQYRLAIPGAIRPNMRPPSTPSSFSLSYLALSSSSEKGAARFWPKNVEFEIFRGDMPSCAADFCSGDSSSGFLFSVSREVRISGLTYHRRVLLQTARACRHQPDGERLRPVAAGLFSATTSY